MKPSHFWPILVFGGILLTGCSTTTLSGSWKSPDYNGKIKKVYIVGMAKQDTTRRILEDDFNRQFSSYGVTGIPSYNDLPAGKDTDEAKVTANIKANGADSVLMTHVTGKRTEEVVNPGRVTSSGPVYGGRYYDRPYYRSYGSYYNQNRVVTYEPATISEFEIITVEANLYDTKTQKLIWSAQLETVLEYDIKTLVDDFVKTVVKDMHSNGLI